MNKLIKSDVWNLILQPSNGNVVSTKWLSKSKIAKQDLCDAGLRRSIDNSWSTYEDLIFLKYNIVSMHNNKQLCVSLLYSKIKHIAQESICDQSLHMTQTMSDCGMIFYIPLSQCVGMCATNSLSNFGKCLRTKHIDIRHYIIREFAKRNLVESTLVISEKQSANILSKTLGFKMVAKSPQKKTS